MQFKFNTSYYRCPGKTSVCWPLVSGIIIILYSYHNQMKHDSMRNIMLLLLPQSVVIITSSRFTAWCWVCGTLSVDLTTGLTCLYPKVSACVSDVNIVNDIIINRLYAIDAYIYHTTFGLWCHFRQCPCDLGSVPAKEGGTVGGGRVSMAASGLSCRKPLISTGWAISLFLFTNGLRKRLSGHVGPPFLAVKLFSRSLCGGN